MFLEIDTDKKEMAKKYLKEKLKKNIKDLVFDFDGNVIAYIDNRKKVYEIKEFNLEDLDEL